MPLNKILSKDIWRGLERKKKRYKPLVAERRGSEVFRVGSKGGK